MLLQGDVPADILIDQFLHLPDLLSAQFGEMGKVETEPLRLHGGAFLLHVGTQDGAQRFVQQVCGCMVVFGAPPLGRIHFRHKAGFGVGRQLFRQVDDEVVLLPGVENPEAFVTVAQAALVARLPAALAVEGGLVKDQLVEAFLFGGDLAVADQLHLGRQGVVTDKTLFGFRMHLYPVGGLLGGCRAGTLLLCRQPFAEALHVNLPLLLLRHQLRQVDGEAVGVEQFEGESAVDHMFVLVVGQVFLEFQDAVAQRAQEGLLLLRDDADNQFALFLQLRILPAHLLHQNGHHAVQERFLEVEEGVSVPDGTAQDAPDHVARLDVGGQLPVRNGEGDGAQVVGTDAHGDVRLFVAAVGDAGKAG